MDDGAALVAAIDSNAIQRANDFEQDSLSLAHSLKTAKSGRSSAIVSILSNCLCLQPI